jgi:P27 family predicted phage terminase small subunit
MSLKRDSRLRCSHPRVAMPRKSSRELEAPPVRLVEPELPVQLPAPPQHLSSEAADWWRAIVADYDLQSHHLKILEAACDAWDRMSTARELLLAEGITSVSKSGVKAHPAIASAEHGRRAGNPAGHQRRKKAAADCTAAQAVAVPRLASGMASTVTVSGPRPRLRSRRCAARCRGRR